jgi:hypothetical protein
MYRMSARVEFLVFNPLDDTHTVALFFNAPIAPMESTLLTTLFVAFCAFVFFLCGFRLKRDGGACGGVAHIPTSPLPVSEEARYALVQKIPFDRSLYTEFLIEAVLKRPKFLHTLPNPEESVLRKADERDLKIAAYSFATELPNQLLIAFIHAGGDGSVLTWAKRAFQSLDRLHAFAPQIPFDTDIHRLFSVWRDTDAGTSPADVERRLRTALDVLPPGKVVISTMQEFAANQPVYVHSNNK